MQTEQIRRQFLDYFKKHRHSIIASSPVVPHDDPTLLFINAGMNQFKDVFLGMSKRDYTRATTSQKCIRVGGKHNDLDNVGHTKRHLTFFEMLGNFSFGDYFKEEAIQFAWEVSTEVFGFEPERIWPTVFQTDDEAYELWKKYVPEERITRFGEKENFWAMGDTGPCGPCSELLYDRGPEFGNASNPHEDTSGERFLEFWNLVFMQYNRNDEGELIPLPKPSVDTGAGIERVVSLKMGVESVFETDILSALIAKTEKISGITYAAHDERSAAFRVIADHLRCLAFAIADGAQPSNVDRGYVLRKVLRRAVRYGRQLGLEEPFLAQILPALIDKMGSDYPELVKSRQRIEEILTTEEEAFIRTLQRGGNMLNQIIDHAKTHGQMITGDEAFKLKDTYGFPLEEILLLAKDADLTVDINRFETLEEEARERSRQRHKVTKQEASESLFEEMTPSKFLGYKEHSASGTVTAIVSSNALVDKLSEGEEGMIVLDRSPFYAEMGGQVGDTGTLQDGDNCFDVQDCVAPFKGIIAHVGRVDKGTLKVGDTVSAAIDWERRQKIANNHTATHLLHWALQVTLGGHVKQAGSVVDATRLRFDFSHHKAVTDEEIKAIEDLVNDKIRENKDVANYELSYDDVLKRDDIKQFFGDKYDSTVRVIDIDYSKELCGGTHTTAVGNIGYFRIAKESSIAAGIRRIEAVTGSEAEELARAHEQELGALADLLKTQPQKLAGRIEKMLEENKELALQVKQMKKEQAASLMGDVLKKMETVNQINLLTVELPISPQELRDVANDLIEQMKSGILVVASAPSTDKCHLIARVSDDIVSRGISAVDIIKNIAPIVGGNGGGKANSAQAGGTVSGKIPEALAKTRELLSNL